MATMRDTLVTYFEGERAQGWFWLATGVVMAAVGLWLLLSRTDYRAAGWPLVVLAAVEIVVGVTGVFNDARVARLLLELSRDEPTLVAGELARMNTFATVFTVMKCVEACIFLSGAALVLTVGARSSWYAVGVGLIIQGGAALTLESIAHRRNAGYRADVAALSALAAGRGAPASTPPVPSAPAPSPSP